MTIIKYDLTGFSNFRDGGGLPTATGRLRTQRLLRSDQPSALDAQDVDYLRDLPLHTVVDLRSETEVLMSPSPFKAKGFNVVRHGIEAGSPTSMLEGHITIDLMYSEMLEKGGKAFAEAVEALAQGVELGAALVHCTAGKDRTGITIAMIQQMLGVEDDAIVQSYSLTQQNLDGTWKAQKVELVSKLMGEHMAKKIEPIMVDSPPEAIQKVLDHLETEFGGAKGYLVEHGMDHSAEEILRDQLLV